MFIALPLSVFLFLGRMSSKEGAQAALTKRTAPPPRVEERCGLRQLHLKYEAVARQKR
jgi:hypothetical protein